MEDNKNLTLKLETTIYSLEAVVKATYKFSGELYIDIIKQDGKSILVKVQNKSSENFDKSILELKNELLDQVLRIKLQSDFQSIREEIVKRAFSSVN